MVSNETNQGSENLVEQNKILLAELLKNPDKIKGFVFIDIDKTAVAVESYNALSIALAMLGGKDPNPFDETTQDIYDRLLANKINLDQLADLHFRNWTATQPHGTLTIDTLKQAFRQALEPRENLDKFVHNALLRNIVPVFATGGILEAAQAVAEKVIGNFNGNLPLCIGVANFVYNDDEDEVMSFKHTGEISRTKKDICLKHVFKLCQKLGITHKLFSQKLKILAVGDGSSDLDLAETKNFEIHNLNFEEAEIKYINFALKVIAIAFMSNSEALIAAAEGRHAQSFEEAINIFLELISESSEE